MAQLAYDQPEAQGLTAKLADHAASLRFKDLPDDVVSIARCCFIDWLGVTLAAHDDPITDMLVTEAKEQGGNCQATVIGDGLKTSISQAALINGTVSHALDYDDVNLNMIGHPSVITFAAMLGLAERDGCSGRDFITAFVAGTEIGCRIGKQLMGESHYQKGWHMTGTAGTFAATASAGQLLGLDGDTMTTAFGIAASQAAGLKSNFGTMCKPMHAGKACQNGLFAASMAKRGWTSNPEILECVQGFGDTQTGAFTPDLALDGLGERFMTRGMLFKFHAACYGTHAAIEATREMREGHGVKADDIASVELHVPSGYLKMCNIHEPKTGLEGKFSLRFTTAMGLLGEDTGRMDSYSEAKCAAPALVAMRDRIQVVANDDLEHDHAVADLRVTKKDGVVVRQTGAVYEPESDQDLQWSRLVEKFQGLATPVIGADKAGQIVDQVGKLETLDKVGPIAELAVK
ncbi:MAG: MmgE/PrpD family protein [Proteobacteria bacterium]|nr:MmgE/PrpD family protein [Pseudomonadota bacterium]